MQRQPEIAITGLGVVCPIGIGTDAMWEAARQARSGVARVSRFDASQLPVQFGAEVADFDPKKFVRPRKSLKVMSREIQMSFAAADMAVAQAGIVGACPPERFGVLFGAGMIYSDFADMEEVYRNCREAGEFVFDRWGGRAMSDIFPLWMLKYLPNMPACHIGIAHDARGPNNTITSDEVSGLLALHEAVHILQRGAADAMIVGGTGCRVNITEWLWRGDSLLSHRHDDPPGASRPFEKDRDGYVNGEGSACLVVERREFAEARGATVLATVRGCGGGFDSPAKGTEARRVATEYSIQQALATAEMTANDLSHACAHSMGLIVEDQIESAAIRNTLGELPVTASKSYYGNVGEGCAAVELVLGTLSLINGEIPPTRNYETPDPQCPVNVVHKEPVPLARPANIVLAQTRSGQTAAAVLARP